MLDALRLPVGYPTSFGRQVRTNPVNHQERIQYSPKGESLSVLVPALFILLILLRIPFVAVPLPIITLIFPPPTRSVVWMFDPSHP